MSANNFQNGSPAGGQSRNPFNYVKVEQIGRDNVSPWLTADEITNHLNLFDDTSQDAYVLALGIATRQAIEDYLGMSILPVTYRVYYGTQSLIASPISLDLPEVSQNVNPTQPGVTINSVGFWDDAFPPVFQVIDSANYFYDPSGNKLIINTLPTSVNTIMTAPIIVQYATVANPLSAYPVIKQAGLLLLTHLYNNRANSTTTGLKDIPFGVTTLLRAYKPLVM